MSLNIRRVTYNATIPSAMSMKTYAICPINSNEHILYATCTCDTTYTTVLSSGSIYISNEYLYTTIRREGSSGVDTNYQIYVELLSTQ